VSSEQAPFRRRSWLRSRVSSRHIEIPSLWGSRVSYCDYRPEAKGFATLKNHLPTELSLIEDVLFTRLPLRVLLGN
jgi:hypothetical protein